MRPREHFEFQLKVWSGRRDSNPRPRPWQGRALPLSYTRIRLGKADWTASAMLCQMATGFATAPGCRAFCLVRAPSATPTPILSMRTHKGEGAIGSRRGRSQHSPAKVPQTMPATPDDLFAFLDRLGNPHGTVPHAAAFPV